jgi:fumarate reductase subunit D
VQGRLEGLTPLLWTLFSAGGTVAALLFPVHLLLTGFAIPRGWVEGPDYAALRSLAGHPVTRLYLLTLIGLPLFHWAHRFRYTLYDGLQLKHLTALIAVICYGGALVATALAAWTMWGPRQ